MVIALLSIAMTLLLSACEMSSDSMVNKLDVESVLPLPPSGVLRGEGELVETRDLFHGKPVAIQIETNRGRVTRDYMAERNLILDTKPIREQGKFFVFNSIGEAYKRPDGFIYATKTSVQSGQPGWYVSCVRWKPEWAPGHGCVLLGHSNGKHYEVIMDETQLPVAEDLNEFVLAHL